MGEGPQHLRPDEGGGRAPEAGELSEQDPETLRRHIDATRDDMGQTLDEISDRVRPSRIVERRSARVRATFRRARDRVMGSGQDAGQGPGGAGEQVRAAAGGMRAAAGNMRERAGQAAGTVEHAPEAALERARGNPLGAGLIAFGAGVVAAGLLPDTRSERRVAMAVTEQLEPVTERLGEAAREVGHEVADSARESARSTAEHAREEVREAARDVRQEGSR